MSLGWNEVLTAVAFSLENTPGVFSWLGPGLCVTATAAGPASLPLSPRCVVFLNITGFRKSCFVKPSRDHRNALRCMLRLHINLKAIKTTKKNCSIIHDQIVPVKARTISTCFTGFLLIIIIIIFA